MIKRSLLLVALAASIAAAAQDPPRPPPEAAGTAAPASGPTAKPERKPTLSGTLLSEVSGGPIQGGTIEVLPYEDAETSRQRRVEGRVHREPIASATSDSGGRFRLEVPPSARVVVTLRAPGHARSALRRALFTPTGSGDRDLGRVSLPEGALLSGRVVDAVGAPVAGATVIAMPPAERGPRRGRFSARTSLFPAVAATGEDGSFRIESAPRRRVSLRTHAPGLAPAVVETALPGAAGRPTVIRLAPGRSVTGRVLAPDGKTPVAEAWILAGEDGWDGLTRSKADGSFALDHLRSGAVTLVATVASAWIDPPDLSGEAAARATWAPSTPLTVKVAPSGTEKPGPEARLRLRPGGMVVAKVLDAETRFAVPGAAIALDVPGERQPRAALTGGVGEVLFTGVPAGSIGLGADADGYLDEKVESRPLAVGSTQQVTAALRPAAAIEGTVRDAAGRPLPGARVSVLAPPSFSRPLPVAIYLPLSLEPLTTEADGSFLLEELPPRTDLKVSVSAPGFVPWEMAGIKLRPGETRSGLEVLLYAGRMISGRLVDREGGPVAGASVVASKRPESGSGGFTIRVAQVRGRGGRAARGGTGMEEPLEPVQSDAQGIFRAGGATTGVWSLRITAPGFAPHTVAGLKLEESGALDAGEIVLAPGAVLRGRVSTKAGEPIPFATGRLMKEFAPLSEFTAEADGTFVTEDLAPGEAVTLIVSADGFGTAEKGGLTPPMEELEIVLPLSSRISGRVVDRDTRRPVTEFALNVSRDREGGIGGRMTRMVEEGGEVSFSSDEGIFLLEDVNPGKVAIGATASGYRPSTVRDLTVPEGEDLEDVVITLERGGSVSGTVQDDRGRPLPGVAVDKKEAASPGFRMQIGSDDATTTDGEGSFFLDGLEVPEGGGRITLTFTHPDYQPAERDVDMARAVEGLRVTLTRGGELVGIVLHESDGSPVRGAVVRASAVGGDLFSGSSTATTGPDGSFVLDGVAPGRYQVRAEAPGFSPAVQDNVVIEAGGSPAPLELRMGGGVVLTGSILGARPEEMAQMTVRAIGGTGGGFGTTAPVDSEGRFEMRGLTPGTMTLVAGAGFMGGRSTSKTIQIPEGATTFEAFLEFPRGYTVEGIVSKGGAPVDGATILFRRGTGTGASATTDSSGRYSLDDLEDGDYDVSVMQFSTGLSHTLKAGIHADRTLDIEMPLATLAGWVRSASSGEPIESATVAMQRTDGAPATIPSRFLGQEARTDQTGRFAIQGVDAGTYSVTAQAQGYGYETRAVTITAAVPPQDLTFDLSRVQGLSFRAVDQASGLPLRSLTAMVLVAGGGDPLASGGAAAATVFQGSLSADASGVFRLASLQPGTYRVVLGGQGLGVRTLHDVIVPSADLQIQMAPKGGLDITDRDLQAGQAARGVLLDSQGRPSHVNSWSSDPAFNLQAGTPATLRDLSPGAYRLRVAGPGGGVIEQMVTVVPGQVTSLSIP